jgi:hypothetical protein
VAEGVLGQKDVQKQVWLGKKETGGEGVLVMYVEVPVSFLTTPDAAFQHPSTIGGGQGGSGPYTSSSPP